MAEIFRWSGDGLSTGNLTTGSAGPGDTAPDAILGTTPPTIVATGPRSPQISCAPSPASDQSAARWVFASKTLLGVRFYFTTGSSFPGSGAPVHICWVDAGGSMIFEIDYTSTARINIRDNTTVLAQTATSLLSTNTRYRIEFTLNFGTGAIALNAYTGDGTTPIASLSSSSANLGANCTRIAVGKLNEVTAPTAFFDDILVLDTATMPGPWFAPIPTAAVTNEGIYQLLDASGSTPGDGGTLAYEIDPDDDVIDLGDGRFLVPNAQEEYTVTVTESPSGLDDDETIEVNELAGAEWPKRPKSDLSGWE